MVNKRELPRRNGPLHAFTRGASKDKPSKRGDASLSSEDEGEEDEDERSRSRAASTLSSRRSSLRRKSGSAPDLEDTSRAPPSTSRKRSESTSTPGDSAEKEKEKEKSSRRLTVAGWASSAVGSVTKKSKDTFAALTGGGGSERLSDREGEESITQATSTSYLTKTTKRRSKDSLGSASPKMTGKILKPPALQSRKRVRAIHGFNGSSEELSFKTGDEILVLNEVLDEWWMGELDGRRGLFPTVYTEVVKSDATETALDKTDLSSSFSECGSSDVEGEHLYGAHHFPPPGRNPYADRFDVASISSSSSSDAEGQEHEKLIPPKVVIPPSLTRAHSATISPPISKRAVSAENVVKRAPPPPPPPRRPTSTGPTSSPRIPERRPGASRSKSSPGTAPFPFPMGKQPSPSTSSQECEYETSPFESASDFTATATVTATATTCEGFRQNPFKPPGMCSNCFTLHT